MTKVLLTPGIGNQLFQLAAAVNCRQHPASLAQVVVSERYLGSKHGGKRAFDLPFVTSVAVSSATLLETLAYFAWQRFGERRLIRQAFKVAGIWMESPLPWARHEATDFSKANDHTVGCGYWQDMPPDAILRGLGAVIDPETLLRTLAQRNMVRMNRLHVRAGDYESAGIYCMLDADYYIDCLRHADGAKKQWEIVTDNPRDTRVQRILAALRDAKFDVQDMIQQAAEDDLLKLIAADTLVCANSTFSISAAYIRDLCFGNSNATYVPHAWFNTPLLKRPSFYAHHWRIH